MKGSLRRLGSRQEAGRGGLQGAWGRGGPGLSLRQDQDLRACLGAPWGDRVGGRVQVQGLAASPQAPDTPGGPQSRPPMTPASGRSLTP